MTKAQEIALLQAIRKAVTAAIAEVGIDGVRSMSMFRSAREAESKAYKIAA